MIIPHPHLKLKQMRHLAKNFPVSTLLVLLGVLFGMLFGWITTGASNDESASVIHKIMGWIGVVVVPIWMPQMSLILYYHFGPGRAEVYGD